MLLLKHWKFAFLTFMVRKFRSKLKETTREVTTAWGKLITFFHRKAFLNWFGSSVYLFSLLLPFNYPEGWRWLKTCNEARAREGWQLWVQFIKIKCPCNRHTKGASVTLNRKSTVNAVSEIMNHDLRRYRWHVYAMEICSQMKFMAASSLIAYIQLKPLRCSLS